jgi:hypothetical protein
MATTAERTIAETAPVSAPADRGLVAGSAFVRALDHHDAPEMLMRQTASATFAPPAGLDAWEQMMWMAYLSGATAGIALVAKRSAEE